MKKNNRLLLSCAALLIGGVFAAGSAYAPPQKRSVKCFNKTWTFIKQDVAVATATAAADPAGWSKVNLPHSFDIPYWRAGAAVAPYIGWYRKHFTVDQSIITAKKRVFVEFNAAFEASQTYVNGTLVGRHNGGYTGFSFDITGNVAAGDNVIAVRVDGSWCDTIAPRSGEHIFIGGIYRDVYLVITDPLHVPWYGTFVSTPQATASSGTVKVKTEIKNDGTAAVASCVVKSIVVDATGNSVTSFSQTASVPAGARETIVATSDAISNPHLWSPSSPYMYTLYTEVYNGTTLVDNFSSPLGFRTATWSATNGFVLNGQKFWLQGANVHQDHAGWGDAIAKTGCFRDVKLVKDCGMNFIRGSHYPHNPAFGDACDKYGICLWAESDFWGLFSDATGWKSGAYPTSSAAAANAFDTNALMQLREFIQIYRNHPSVIVWSMGNEVWFNSDGTRTNALIHKMMQMANLVDSTRMAGMGGVQSGGEDALVGGWGGVAGENGSGGAVMNPGYPSMVTEYGSCQEERPGNLNACWGNELTAQLNGNLPTVYAWRGGYSLWCAFHHGSDNNAGNMGMCDHARLPLRRWYFYRNLYLGTPNPTWPVSGTASKLKLTTDIDTITDDGTTDCQLIVQVQDASGAWISNTPDITLTDKSNLGSFPTGSSITFTGGALEKGVREGLAAIEFRSYNAGTVTIEASSGSLPKVSVNITVLHVDDTTVNTSRIPSVSQITVSNREKVFAGYGNRIVIPGSLMGKKFAVSLFDTRGRLVDTKTINRGGALVRRNAAEGIVIAKVNTIDAAR